MYIPFKKEELGCKPEDEDIVIKEYHKFIKNLNQNKTNPESEVMDYELFRKATMNNELVIDKYLTLNFPITDSGCSDQRRQLYLMQEELMVALAEIERENIEESEVWSCEGSAPIAQSTFPVPTDADLAVAKEQNKIFLVWLEKHCASSF
jgi:hypothetical protein